LNRPGSPVGADLAREIDLESTPRIYDQELGEPAARMCRDLG